jgi:hypothetical protein
LSDFVPKSPKIRMNTKKNWVTFFVTQSWRA